MEKSPDAFRTISEVADHLGTPAHVLRFWESRFPQIRPVKRAGGRRYYRPSDVALLSGIRRLLHDEGLTIRGVQKLLREQGVRHVAGLGAAEAEEAGAWIDAQGADVGLAATGDEVPVVPAEAAPDTAVAETPAPDAPAAPPRAAPIEELPLFAALQPAAAAPAGAASAPDDRSTADMAPEPAPTGTAPPGAVAVPVAGTGALDDAQAGGVADATAAPASGFAMPPSAPFPEIAVAPLLAVLRALGRGSLAGDARVAALAARLADLRAARAEAVRGVPR